jgi:hypothetical protein
MNINFGTFLTQCAVMGVWVFIVAGIFAVIEKFVKKHYPGFFALEEAGASQKQDPPVTAAEVPNTTPTAPKQV